MPNRILKESITTSETLASLSAEEERCFMRLLVVVDDFGRFDGRPAIIRARCFAAMLERVSDQDVGQWVLALQTAGLLRLYLAGGKAYLTITTFNEHQQRRATKSKFPDPPAVDDRGSQPIASDIGCHQSPSATGNHQDSTCRQVQADAPVFGNENELGNESAAPARTTLPAVRDGGGMMLMRCPRELTPTPGMLAELRRVGCLDPAAEAALYVSTHANSGRRELSWLEDGRAFESWVSRHDQMGCVARKRGGPAQAKQDRTITNMDTMADQIRGVV